MRIQLCFIIVAAFSFIACDEQPEPSPPHSQTEVWNVAKRPDSGITIFGTNSRNYNWHNTLDNSIAPDQVISFGKTYHESGDRWYGLESHGANLFAVGKYLPNGDFMVFGGLGREYLNQSQGLWVRKYVRDSFLAIWHRDVLYELQQDPFITSAICREDNGFAVAGYRYNGGSYVVLIDDEANVAGVTELEDERSHTFLKDYPGQGVYFLSSSLYYIDNGGNIITEIPPVSGDSLSWRALAVSHSGSAFVAGLVNGTRIGIREYNTDGGVLNQYEYNGDFQIKQVTVTSDSGFVIAGTTHNSTSEIAVWKLNRNNEIVWQVTNSMRGESEVRDLLELHDGSFAITANEEVDRSFTEAFLMSVSSSGQIQWRRSSRIQ